jgi:hypothetical protein
MKLKEAFPAGADREFEMIIMIRLNQAVPNKQPDFKT